MSLRKFYRFYLLFNGEVFVVKKIDVRVYTHSDLIHNSLIRTFFADHFDDDRPEELVPLSRVVNRFSSITDARQNELVFDV